MFWSRAKQSLHAGTRYEHVQTTNQSTCSWVVKLVCGWSCSEIASGAFGAVCSNSLQLSLLELKTFGRLSSLALLGYVEVAVIAFGVTSRWGPQMQEFVQAEKQRLAQVSTVQTVGCEFEPGFTVVNIE